MVYVWLGLMLLFLVMEAATVGLVSIWFAAGALAGLLATVCGAQEWLQVVCFVAVSGVTLLLVRPLARKHINTRSKATNADRVLEMTGIVSEDIDNIRATGTVTVDGKAWTARSADGTVIPAGTYVRPVRIDGVKLIVCPAPQPAEAAK